MNPAHLAVVGTGAPKRIWQEMPPYASRWGFETLPFPVTPDETGYFLTPRNEAVMEELRHFISLRKGFMLLSGEIGLGKTTLLRRLISSLESDRFNSALVLTSFLDQGELLESIVRDFGIEIDPENRRIDLLHALINFLLEQHHAGKVNVLFIDDAQSLGPQALDVIRQLSNLETSTHKLIQVVLCGQPELLETLDRHDLRQVRSRIALTCSLEPMSVEEIDRYISHRMRSAGARGDLPSLDTLALTELHRVTGGTPRRVNHLMDRCLYGLYVNRQHRITSELIIQAAWDLGWKPTPSHQSALATDPAPSATLATSPEPQLPHASPAVVAAAAASSPGSATPGVGSSPWMAKPGGAGLLNHPLHWALLAIAVAAVGLAAWSQHSSRGHDARADVRLAPAALPSNATVAAGTEAWRSFRESPQLAAPGSNDIEAVREHLQRQLQGKAPETWQVVRLPGREGQTACGERAQLALAGFGSERLAVIEQRWPVGPVALGQSDAAVHAAQRVLASQGLMGKGDPEGPMNAKTMQAMAQWQAQLKLPGTGQFDAWTAYHLSCVTAARGTGSGNAR